MLEASSLLLIVVVLIFVCIFVASTRRASHSAASRDDPADDQQTISNHASTELLALQRSIDELRRIETPSLEHVRDLGRLLAEAYPSRVTSVQQPHIEAAVYRALIGKRVCWELEVNDVKERTMWFWDESREAGGFWLEHIENPPFLVIVCHTYDRNVVCWGQKQPLSASGRIAKTKINWPSLHLLVSSATVNARPGDRVIPVNTVYATNTETTLSRDPVCASIPSRLPDIEREQLASAPSYQTAPLTTYSRALLEHAENLFKIVSQQIGPKAQRYKGSFTVFAKSSSETAGKIVVYQRGLGRENGRWPALPDGVYVLVRCNGLSGRTIWQGSLLRSNMYWQRLDPERTLGIAPKHDERFAYFRLEPEDKIEIVAALLVACSRA